MAITMESHGMEASCTIRLPHAEKRFARRWGSYDRPSNVSRIVLTFHAS